MARYTLTRCSAACISRLRKDGEVRWATAYIWNNKGDPASLIDNYGQEPDYWAYG